MRGTLVEVHIGVGVQRCVAEGLGAERGFSAQAEVGVAIAIVVAIEIEGRRIGRGKSAQLIVAKGHAEGVVAGAQRDAAAVLAIAAAMRAHGETLGLAGEDLDHATDRVRTPERRARAAHDLDALDLVERKMREIEHALGGGRDTHAVDQHKRVIRIGAAQEHRAGLARTAGARNVHAGLLPEQAEQIDRRAFFDGAAVDHRDRCKRVVDGLRVAHAGDDDYGLVGGRLRMHGRHWDGRSDQCRKCAATR